MSEKQTAVQETAEQKELRELREEKAQLKKQLEQKDNDLKELVGEALPVVNGIFPGNIVLMRLLRDEQKMPTHYEEVEVPEDTAHDQMSKPVGERIKPYRDLCYKENVDQRFLQ